MALLREHGTTGRLFTNYGWASYAMEPASFDPVPQNIVEAICKERGTFVAA